MNKSMFLAIINNSNLEFKDNNTISDGLIIIRKRKFWGTHYNKFKSEKTREALEITSFLLNTFNILILSASILDGAFGLLPFFLIIPTFYIVIKFILIYKPIIYNVHDQLYPSKITFYQAYQLRRLISNKHDNYIEIKKQNFEKITIINHE